MLFHSMADGMTTVADVVLMLLTYVWQMVCQGVADRLATVFIGWLILM